MKLSPEAVSILRRASKASPRAFLVGGALRDLWLEREVSELDIACESPRKAAMTLAGSLAAAFVTLDTAHGVYRVAFKHPRKGIRHLDLVKLSDGGIMADLGQRDFTINAMALPLGAGLAASVGEKDLIDPRGGLKDLRRGLVRTETAGTLEEDPLRILRAYRLAAQLGLVIDGKTLEMIRRCRGLLRRPAAERVQAEVLALLAVPGCAAWLRLMDEQGVLTVVFEELEAGRRCALEYYGPGGVMTHTLNAVARADYMLGRLAAVFPASGAALAAHLESLPGGIRRQRAVLMLATLLHDVAKPSTARRIRGRLRFFGHEEKGADAAEAILRRLRFSRDDISVVRTVIAHHLRPGNLAAGGRVTDRAAYRFFRDTGEHAVSLLLVAWADHASYLAERKLVRHLPLLKPPERLQRLPEDCRKTLWHLWTITDLLGRRFAQLAAKPERLVDGNDVMKALGLGPGPRVGQILEKVAEAQAEGRVADRGQALEFLEKFRARVR
ncbi:MAG: HD domain-containing protein [Elusimicrobia bacterium]|nr:HD domain-containing protein [Elusimicrobiota bacterium]